MARVAETNADVIAEFRANGGEVAAPYENPPPMLLLHTIGARSGREHVVPMRALVDGETLYVFGSAHGSARHPDWYHNVITHPDFTIEKGTETIPVHATELHGAERDAIFARQAARFPVFAAYQQRLARTIPVIRLDRRAPDEPHHMPGGAEGMRFEDLTALIDRDLLAWPGVRKESRGSQWGAVVIYWLGERQIGHIHADGVADLQFPKAVHDTLVAEGRAAPHRGGFAAVVSYTMRESGDVPGAVELFRLNYDRIAASAEARAQRMGDG